MASNYSTIHKNCRIEFLGFPNPIHVNAYYKSFMYLIIRDKIQNIFQLLDCRIIPYSY